MHTTNFIYAKKEYGIWNITLLFILYNPPLKLYSIYPIELKNVKNLNWKIITAATFFVLVLLQMVFSVILQPKLLEYCFWRISNKYKLL